MRILLLGRHGQVGRELERALAPLGELITLGRQGSHDLCGDLTQPESLRESARSVAPDVIVNAAAYTAVDQAESEPELAHAVNATAPAALAEAARSTGAWLVHYSTDYVFDGSGQRPWREDDATRPLNAYGRTKLAGETAVQEGRCCHLILRTSWVFSGWGKNFIRTMLRLASERDALRVIDDQYGAPTGAALIADVTAHALRGAMGDRVQGGVYHLAAAGETTWYDYARYAIDRAREAGWPVKVAEDGIARVPTEAFPTAAERPRNSRLDCRKLETTFGLRMPDWRGAVARVVDEVVANRA